MKFIELVVIMWACVSNVLVFWVVVFNMLSVCFIDFKVVILVFCLGDGLI